MCAPYGYGSQMTLFDSFFTYGIKVFVLLWIIFVPIVITNRLEKIIKLLQEKK